MELRDLVAVLYLLGAALTAGGVLIGYRQAIRQKRHLDELAALSAADREPDFVETFGLARAGEVEEVTAQVAARAAREAELEAALRAVGIEDRPPTWNDMRLPVAYWSKRSALADTVASFKTGGLVALSGLVVSTIASVWSLYL